MQTPFACKLLTKAAIFVGLLSLIVGAPDKAASLVIGPFPVPSGGVLSYAGDATPLIGSIPFATGTPITENGTNVASIEAGTLNFTTGNATGFVTHPLFGSGIAFGPGGTMNVQASVIYPPGPAEPTAILLQGTFTSATVFLGQLFQPQFDIIATFTDLKNDQLVSFFGLPANVPYTGDFHIAGTQSGTAPYSGGPFTTTAFQGGLLFNEPIPEPSTWLLLGSGLAGMMLWRKRKNERIGVSFHRIVRPSTAKGGLLAVIVVSQSVGVFNSTGCITKL